MPLEGGAISEASAALLTGVWLLSGVGAQMNLEGRCLDETLPTIVTREWSEYSSQYIGSEAG